MSSSKIARAAWILILVSALGYFVDVFDILLFSVVRTTSLKELGVPADQLLNVGISLINAQMIGMLIGGILWGVYGDKKGRLSVLFGSIFIYSIANLLNASVTSVDQYLILRFFAGLGLAGELGAGITLVAETLPKEKRGLGTTIIATVGVGGGLAASMVTHFWDWRMAYRIASFMGIALLVLRVSVHESKMFKDLITQSSVPRGSLKLLFTSKERVLKFLACIFAGVPIYFVLGILIAFAPEVGAARGLGATLTAGDAVFFSYVGFILGDLGSGLLSQWLQNRRKVVLAFVLLTFASCAALLLLPDLTLSLAHALYVAIGLFAGYWAVISTVAAEQFGTNLRATVTTSAPNLIRGAVVPLTLITKALIPSLGLISASLIMLAVVTGLAVISILKLKESFSTDLDFNEVA